MAKKDLASVTTDLSALASMLPTQRATPVPAAPSPIAAEAPALKVVAPPKKEVQKADDPLMQFSFSLRKNLRKQLSRLADDADMTMRAFVLNALKAKGLPVREDDLLDLRKEPR